MAFPKGVSKVTSFSAGDDVYQLEISPSGDIIAYEDAGDLVIKSTSDYSTLQTLSYGSGVGGVDISANYIVISEGQNFHIVERGTWNETGSASLSVNAEDVAIDPQENYFGGSTGGQSSDNFKIYNVPDCSLNTNINYTGDPNATREVDWSPDSNWAAFGMLNSKVHIVDASDWSEHFRNDYAPSNYNADTVGSVQIDDNYLYNSHSTAEVDVWSISSTSLVTTISETNFDNNPPIAKRKDNEVLAISDGAGETHFYDPNNSFSKEFTYNEGSNPVLTNANGGSYFAKSIGSTVYLYEYETDTTAPTAPSNLSKSNVQTTQVDLDWDGSSDSGGSGLDHYNVYEDTGTGFSKLKEVSAGSTSTTVTSGSGGASYDYYVTAVDGAGNESSASNTVTVNYEVSKPSDYNTRKFLDVDSVSGAPTIGKAQPVLITGERSSTTQSEETTDPNRMWSANLTTTVSIESTETIISEWGFEIDNGGSWSGILQIIDQNSNVLASKNISNRGSQTFQTYSFTESDYSRIPSNEDISVVLTRSSGSGQITNNNRSLSDTLYTVNDAVPAEYYTVGGTFIEVTELAITESKTGTGDIVLDWTNISGPEDIAIYDQNGNLLDYEIESLDTTAETAVLWAYNSWVRDGTTQAQIAYGANSANTDRQNVTATWGNTGQNAVMVQHLQDDPITATDSTPNNFDGNVTEVSSVSGQLGNAGSWDGANDGIITSGQISSSTNAGSKTYMAWMKYEGGAVSNGDRDNIIHTNSGNFESNTATGQTVTLNEWHLVALTFDSSTGDYELSIDGQSVYTGNSTFTITDMYFINENELVVQEFSNVGSTEINIGYQRTDDWSYKGDMDEVKFYSANKSLEWLKAEHDASPKAGQVFFSQQAAEPAIDDQPGSVIETNGSGVKLTTSAGVFKTDP